MDEPQDYPSRHQNADDRIGKKVAFRHFHADASVEETFWINGDWQLVGTKKLGEMTVHHTADGPLIRILMEIQQ